MRDRPRRRLCGTEAVTTTEADLQVRGELEAMRMVNDELTTLVAEQTRHIRDLERALWMACGGMEFVVHNDTPRSIEWKTMDDGGRLVRRAR